MNLGSILKFYLQYATFKTKAKEYLEQSRVLASVLMDDDMIHLVAELEALYKKLP